MEIERKYLVKTLPDHLDQYESKKINDVLGTELPKQDVLDVFRKLGFSCKQDGEKIEVSVPRRRLDISIKEDLIEEVQRLRMENAYLKKLQALVQKRTKPKQSKK